MARGKDKAQSAKGPRHATPATTPAAADTPRFRGFFGRALALIGGANGLTVILTAAMAGTSFSQWRTMVRQADQTDATIQQMRLEQRAWLGIQQPELRQLAVGKRVNVLVPIFNSGATPGHIRTWATGIVALQPSEGLDKAFDNLATAPPTQNVVPPDQRFENDISTPFSLDSDVVLEQIQNRPGPLRGRIRPKPTYGVLLRVQTVSETAGNVRLHGPQRDGLGDSPRQRAPGHGGAMPGIEQRHHGTRVRSQEHGAVVDRQTGSEQVTSDHASLVRMHVVIFRPASALVKF